jgi:hypothetical protein
MADNVTADTTKDDADSKEITAVQPITDPTAKDPNPAETAKAPACKKHGAEPDKRSKKKKKAPETSDSSSESSSSSDSSSETSASECTSGNELDRRKRHRQRTRARARRAMKNRRRTKKRSRRSDSDPDASSPSDSEDAGDSDPHMFSSTDEKALRKLMAQLQLNTLRFKGRPKRFNQQASDDLSISDPLGDVRQKRKKKKTASKVAFKRVDQRMFMLLVYEYHTNDLCQFGTILSTSTN